jgi:hypothetical protein
MQLAHLAVTGVFGQVVGDLLASAYDRVHLFVRNAADSTFVTLWRLLE